MNLILYAIPFFFLLILAELAWGFTQHRNTYRINDTINSLSMGSLSRLQSLVILGVSSSIYEQIADHYQLRQLPGDRIWVWIVCFVLYDLAYYWKHRLGHEMAIFWGSHVAHHQSEDFNLGTALRQTSIDFYSFLFYVPFFALGFPAEVLFTTVSLNLIYQFWVHTEHVPKLGTLEWIFVTPSNHRVHHARNKIYVDRNYGGVFIIWDRLFRSFQEELSEEPVVFGLRNPLNSWNPVWANVHVYWRLIKDFIKAPGLMNKLAICFKPPGWQPEDMVSSCKQRSNLVDLTSRFDPVIPTFSKYYVLGQFVISVLLSLYLLQYSSSLGYEKTVIAVLFMTYSFYIHGRWLEDRPNALGLEILRMASLIVLIQFVSIHVLLKTLIGLYAALSLLTLFAHKYGIFMADTRNIHNENKSEVKLRTTT